MTNPPTTTAQAIDLPAAMAATHALRTELQIAHWNITGPNFIALHELLGEQYDELGIGLDMLAERHRHLGHTVPRDVLATDAPAAAGDWQNLLGTVVTGHEALLELLHDVEAAAAEAGDPGTADLATERIRAHHEHAWKLRAHLE